MTKADVGSNPTLTARAGISNGRVAAGTVEIYVEPGRVISRFDSDFPHQILVMMENLDV